MKVAEGEKSMQRNEMNEKIERLLCELTLEEKISMIHGARLFETSGVERLHIPPLKMSDGPMGVRREFHRAEWIPVGTPVDFVTYCPSNSALAMTWNRELAKKTGQVLGEEARGRGKDVILAPGINIKRLSVCGRNFEYISEDPYLVSQLVVPLIQGIETADVAACVKHFALNNQETERLWVNVEVDERALREIYLPGFEAAVKEAAVKSLMGAYNLLRGEHCCHSQFLLGQILRTEWNYDGMIVSDWGAVHDTKEAALSPLDIEMSVTPDFDDYHMAHPLLNAIEKGEIAQAEVDKKIRNILRLMFRLNMIDVVLELSGQNQNQICAVPDPTRKKGSYNTPEHRKAVLEAARESIVLLKNEEKRLPLQEQKVRKLLVIGQNAVTHHALGGGSAEIKALYEISPLLGITELLGGNCEVSYVPGYDIPPKEESERNWQEDSLEGGKPKTDTQQQGGWRDTEEHETDNSKRLREEAVRLAGQYDDVIFIGGLNHDQDTEEFDRENMTLPYGQDRLIEELLNVNKEMIIVMMAGSPVSMTRWLDKAKALVWISYCGMEGGTALAEILFGNVNPSGKLAETLPVRMEETSFQSPLEYPGTELDAEEAERMQAKLTERYEEGIFVGYRYYEKYQIPVQFCFGHGLSYTDFHYHRMSSEWEVSETGEKVLVVKLQVQNEGSREGKEIIQLYLGEKNVSQENAVKELKGFEKVLLQPKEQKEIIFRLKKKDFMHYDPVIGGWLAQEGTYVVRVGRSLVDIRCETEVVL